MRLLYMAVNRDIEVAVSQPIVEEVIRVLRDKFEWDGYRLHDAVSKYWARDGRGLDGSWSLRSETLTSLAG
jgi:hypothetical protein